MVTFKTNVLWDKASAKRKEVVECNRPFTGFDFYYCIIMGGKILISKYGGRFQK